jgi:hypothetical protein
LIRLNISWQISLASITLGVGVAQRKKRVSMTQAAIPVDYLGLGRQLAGLLG